MERTTNWPKTFLSALIWLILFWELVNFFLTSQTAIVFSLLHLIGLLKPTNLSTSRDWIREDHLRFQAKQEHSDEKQYSSLSSTLKLKELVKKKKKKKKIREKSRECHNHKSQPFLDTKRKKKQTKPNKRKSNKRTKRLALSSPSEIIAMLKDWQHTNKITQGKT